MLPSLLPLLKIKERLCLPLVQGGMGVGVSAHRLAGSVARWDAVGTIASVDLRRLHPDLMAECHDHADKESINHANLVALDREIRGALEIAQGRGLVAVNIMRATSEYHSHVRQACESGAGAVVVGAGLPLDLPETAADFPQVALIPILSDIRGITIVLKKWLRKNRIPDAIVIEHPRYAGGHLGAPDPNAIQDPRFDFETVLPAALELFKELGLEKEQIPLIPAGGINSHEQARRLIDLGAAAVQLGTPFAVTEEGDAHDTFKKVLAEAEPEDIVTFMSVAGLPARAVRTPWLTRYLERLEEFKEAVRGKSRCILVWDCLLQCGLRDGIARFGQFCIDNHLAAALRGDLQRGLFFRGAGRLPFGKAIRPVKELIEYILTGRMPGMASPA